jgi:hypothetical protein
MQATDPTIDEHLAELRDMLNDSAGHHREVIRPVVPVGVRVSEETGRKFLHSDYGPVTVVTFYIAHLPADELPLIPPVSEVTTP